MRQKKLITAAACACLILSSASGASYAYMVDSGALENTFHTSTIHVDAREPAWEALPDSDHDNVPDMASRMTAGRTVAKDPKVENDSDTEAWAFLSVEVPVRDVMLVSTAPEKSSMQELFSFTPKAGWKEMARMKTGSKATYVYGWETKLKPGEATGSLFDSVAFADVVEGEIRSGDTLRIEVLGIGVQGQVFNTIDEAYGAVK